MLRTALAVAATFALFAAPAGASAAPAAGSATGSPAAIIGGTEVGDDVRFSAALIWTGVDRVRCTATVIGAQWLLTARHCLPGVVTGANGTWPITARVGHPEHAKGESIVVEKAFELPKKGDGRTTIGDLALLKLSRPVTNPSPLPLADAAPKPGPGVIYGYGYICAGSDCPLAARLKTATVNHVDGQVHDYEGNPGLAVLKGNGHPTNGDSGGPLLVNGKLVGVASMGQNPSIYSPLAPHRSWVTTVTGI